MGDGWRTFLTIQRLVSNRGDGRLIKDLGGLSRRLVAYQGDGRPSIVTREIIG